ncbi:MAG: DsbA family protein [Candidatus Chisholmbacteria bacterium]|nr:DsbA family protein [Candidatus Chisholmbacteria bacterium]
MAKKSVLEELQANPLSKYVLVGLMIGAAFWTGTLYQRVRMFESGQQVAGTQTGTGAAPAPEVATPLSDDQWQELLASPAAVNGSEDAAVTIVEFTDYQCPFCKQAFDATYPQIVADYIETGKVRYVIRDLPLSFHPNAKPAALAARCAGEQGKYLAMHDALFENQNEWINLSDPAEQFKEYAQELGLSADFAACYDGDRYGAVIDDDLALAQTVGATGTPTFFINGKPLIGAQPYSAFQAAIEGELE